MAKETSWTPSEITSMTDSVGRGVADIIGSFSWMRKTPDSETVNYYTTESRNNWLWIILAVIAVAVIAFFLVKK